MKRTASQIATLLLSLIVVTAYAHAQEDLIQKYFGGNANVSTSTTPSDAELEELKNQILQKFGFPAGTPINVIDILKGLGNGQNIINDYIPPPLSDLKIVFNNNSFNPGEQVRAVLVTFSADLADATVRWRLNGTPVLNNQTGVSLTFTLGQAGSPTTISATVTARDGSTKTVTETIYPSRVYLTWHSSSYIPAWYPGKAFPTSGTSVTVVAHPDFRLSGAQLNPASLIYTWSVDGNNVALSGGSGIGRNSYTLNLSRVKNVSYRVAVSVTDVNKKIVNEGSIMVSAHDTETLFYEKDSLYGAKYTRAIQDARIIGGNYFSLQAEPFFIPRLDFKNMNYTWRINGTRLASEIGDKRTLNFTTEKASRGTQVVSVDYESVLNPFLRGRGQTTINVQSNEN